MVLPITYVKEISTFSKKGVPTNLQMNKTA